MPVKRLTLFITGTDTGAGKTVLAGALARHLRAKDFSVGALKPVCAGGRGDARVLQGALAGALTLDEINPWHFRAPIAPLLAARRENRKLKLAEVVAHVRRMHERFSILIVEGAGGLLSPLGEDFDSRDLIKALGAVPLVVCPNRLGAINQVRLVLAALPRGVSRTAQVVLSGRKQTDSSSRGNVLLLGEKLGGRRVHLLPQLELGGKNRRVDGALEALVRAVGL